MDEHEHQIPATAEQPTRPLPPSGAKRLYRSADKKLFLGVCGGLAEYFDIDPLLVRLLFVGATLLGGVSIALYLVLALIMPSEAMLEAPPREAARGTVDEAINEIRRIADQAVAEVKRALGR